MFTCSQKLFVVRQSSPCYSAPVNSDIYLDLCLLLAPMTWSSACQLTCCSLSLQTYIISHTHLFIVSPKHSTYCTSPVSPTVTHTYLITSHLTIKLDFCFPSTELDQVTLLAVNKLYLKETYYSKFTFYASIWVCTDTEKMLPVVF